MKIRILALVGLLLSAGTAQALPTISMIWRDPANPTGPALGDVIGTPTIAVNDRVVADVVLTGDATGPSVNGVFITIEFNTGKLFATGAQELATVNLPGMGNSMSPIGIGTAIDNTLGRVTNFDEGTTTTGLATSESRTLGSVAFQVVAATGTVNDPDVVGSLVNVGTDTISTTAGASGANFVSAAVVPEPASAALGVAALATLLGLKRRRN
jgi:hypothetical protein